MDKRSGEIVIRVVFDGAAEAGKTTNVQFLTDRIALQRRGKVQSPGTAGRRTEFFDWLDFAGGFIDGSRVRCQLVSVPGQPSLLRRRRYLLKAADAVVYVADSRADFLPDNQRSFHLLSRSLATAAKELPVGILVQANKQDLADALSPDALRTRLDIAPDIPVLGACAIRGDGVMQSFLMAMRMATDRVRELLLAGALGNVAVDADTPELLYEAMAAAERATRDETADANAPRPTRQAFPTPTPAAVPTPTPAAVPTPTPAAVPTPTPAAVPTPTPAAVPTPAVRPGAAAPAKPLPEKPEPIPSASTILAGHVWPPIKGRSILAAVNAVDATVAAEPMSWAPRQPTEWRTDNGWLIHTCPAWAFSDHDRARTEFTNTIRRCASSPLAPDQRAVVLSERTTSGWNMWLVSRRIESLSELLLRALVSGVASAVTAALQQLLQVVSSLRASDAAFPGLDALGVQRGRAVALAVPAPPEGPNVPADPLAQLEAVVTAARADNAAAGGVFRRAAQEVELYAKLGARPDH